MGCAESGLRFLYIDPVDFSAPVSGSGNAAVASSAIANANDEFIFVGLTSSDDPIGRLVEKEIGQHRITAYYVGRVTGSATRSVPIIPQNLAFAARVVRHLRSLRGMSRGVVLTRTYTVVWLLAFLFKRFGVLYYIPGLGNPMLVGRRPRIGSWLARIFDGIQRHAIGRTSAVYAAASAEAVLEFNKRLERFGINKRVDALPTAVDTDLFQPSGSASSTTEGVLHLVFVGRLAAVKNIPFLLDVLSVMRHRGVDAVLTCIGEGEERDHIEYEIRKRGLTENVKLVGNVATEAVARSLQAADVFVLASHTEGFSNAMVEALACGLPIVCTDVSGAREIVHCGKNGFVVSDPSADAFADCVLRATNLVDAPAYARSHCLANYSDKELWRRILFRMRSIENA